ncbi:MAG TPA: TonB-dependent receptor [Blastocatellia bacterium]|nr:TonB-dependent receptor [Blastocatellia bacterium]
MRKPSSYLRIFLTALMLLPVGPVLGQGTTSRVTGTVLDSGGAIIPGATVTLTNEATQISYTTDTTSTGTYVFDSVQVGTYTVTVEKSGFKKFVSAGNQLSIGQPMTVNVELEIGQVSETVEVHAAAELVQTSSSGNFGNTLEQRTIEALPIVGARGRNPLDLVLFQPGVVTGTNTGGGIHVHGTRDRAWNFTLDGIDINETSAGGSNFTPIRTNPDSISEFRVITSNFTAEYGRNSGAQVAMITRSGTNEFHGTAFWFYRTPGLNANEVENISQTRPLPRDQFVQHIPGFSLGGPIIKNKTFFFTNLQVLRARISRIVTRTVYTEQARNGIFRYVIGGRNAPAGSADPAAPPTVDFSGNVLPGINIGTYNIAASDPEGRGLDPTIQALLSLTPLPNDFTVGDGLNTAGFAFTPIENERQEDLVVKIDHAFNERHTVYGRYAWGRQDTFADRVNGGEPRFPGLPSIVDTARSPRNLAVNWRWSPTERFTNELVGGLNRFTFNFLNPDPEFLERPGFILNTVTDPFNNEFGNLRRLTTYQVVDNAAYITGPHTFKGGLNFRYQQHVDTRGSVAGVNIQPSINFSTAINTVDPATFGIPGNMNTAFDRPRLQATINNLLGRVGRISQGFVAASQTDYAPGGTPFEYDARYGEYDFYAQDTWKVRPNLTLDLGLRWEVKLSPRGGGGREVLVPNQRITLGAEPDDAIEFVDGELYDDDWNNIAPSVGLAWDPFGSGKTSIRANYRVAYDRINTIVISSTIFQSAPGATLAVLNDTFGQGGGRLRDGLPTVAPPPGITPEQFRQPAAFSNAALTVLDSSWRTPKTHQWGVSFQREIGFDSVVQVNYIGNRGVGLFGGYDVNQVDIFNNGFLDAFKVVQAGGESPLINDLLSRDTRRRANESGSQMVRRLFTSALSLNSAAAVAADFAARLQGGVPAYVLAGFSPSFFKPYPQFGSLFVLDSNDYSNYNALELQVQRRYRNGLSLQFSYTLSASRDTRSFDPAFTRVSTGSVQSASSTPFDLRDRSLNYAYSDFDSRHVLQGGFVAEIPIGRNRRWGGSWHPAVDRVLGGWEVAGVFRRQSGRPFTIYSGSNTVSNVVQSLANCNGCDPHMGEVRINPENGIPFFFSEGQIEQFTVPAAGEMGNTGRNAFRGPRRINLDLMIGKRTRIIEGHDLEFRLEMTNATNTPSYGLPNSAVITNPDFGLLRNSFVSASRKVQLALKYNF